MASTRSSAWTPWASSRFRPQPSPPSMAGTPASSWRPAPRAAGNSFMERSTTSSATKRSTPGSRSIRPASRLSSASTNSAATSAVRYGWADFRRRTIRRCSSSLISREPGPAGRLAATLWICPTPISPTATSAGCTGRVRTSFTVFRSARFSVPVRSPATRPAA